MLKDIIEIGEKYEVLTYKEFWARNPAPDTIYLESNDASRVVAHPINPNTDEPDDIVMIGGSPMVDYHEQVIVVLKWGNWDNHKELSELHKKAVESIHAEGEYKHECTIGFNH